MKKGQTRMAKKLGIDTGNMSQADANLLATSQIAGGDIRRKGAIGEEISAKVDKFASSSTIASIAGSPYSPAAPTTSVAQTAVTPAPVATAPVAPTTTAATSSPTTPAAQETPVSLLAQLNSSMQQLVAITKSGNEKQLRATNGMSGNLYAAV
jgi:hypothetical protein